jgi:hypothetical protein
VREPVEFAYQGYVPFAQSSSTDIEQKAGIYFPTRDASELQVLFQKIAREVLFKLVE